jgi:hypothetical protein
VGINWGSVADWMAALGTIFAGIVALGIALAPWFTSKFWKPKLAMILRPAVDFGTYDTPAGLTHWFRIWVDNGDGTAAGDSVEVIARRAFKMNGGRPERISAFVPTHLGWTHDRKRKRSAKVHKRLGSLVDVGYVPKEVPQNSALLLPAGARQDLRPFVLNTLVQPTDAFNHLPPGEYRIELHLVADNFDPLVYTLGIRWSGEWQENICDLYPSQLELTLSAGPVAA